LVFNKTTDALTVAGLVTAGSATITGDLTVDTNTLKVDSTNDNVIVGATSAIGGGRFSVQADLSAKQAICAKNSAASYSATNNFIRFTNSTDTTVGGITHPAVTSLGVWGVSDIQFLLSGAGSTAMTLNSNGLGVGAVPSAWATYKAISVGGIGASVFGLGSSQSGVVQGAFFNNGSGSGWAYSATSQVPTQYLQINGENRWFIAGSGTASAQIASWTQAMTLDASGNLLVGTTTALASGNTFQNLGINRQVLTLKGDTAVSYTSGIWNASTTGDALFQYFATETSLTVRGGISYNRAGGLVAYNTTSDYRAKDIIGSVSNSGSLIDSLKVYVGKMKGATIERPMLIAHEAQEVAPYAVTGTKDEIDADGKDKYQQMDVSSFVPLLIAEIQSLRARVQTLEAR